MVLLASVLRQVIDLLHPVMPFITEELNKILVSIQKLLFHALGLKQIKH